MKFLGLGDNVIDEYINTKECFPGGNALNFACHIAKLKEEAAYLGNIADDRYGKIILRALQEMHVSYANSPIIENSSTKRCLYEVIDGERHFVEVDLGFHWAAQVQVKEYLDYISSFTLVHCCCNAKMEHQMSLLWNLPVIFTYDFGEKEKYRVDAYYRLICQNLDLALFSCREMTDEEVRAFCEPLHHLGVKHILITMGSHGQYVSNGKMVIKGNVEQVKAVDTMGAGDAFLAAFVVSLVHNGWKKGIIMDECVIQKALKEASAYAKENCLVAGAFGFKG